MVTSKKADWAGKIRAAWQKSVAAIFEVGDLLSAAKAALPHGRFEKMVQRGLPFGERTAQCLMALAKDARLRKAHHGALLPPSWRTLYELSRLSDENFSAALADGLITPEMRRSDIADMMARRESAERRASTSPFEPATEPAPISLTAGPATAHPFRYAPAPPLPPDAADHSALTITNLAELAPVHSANRIVEALVILQREGAQCRDLSVVANQLLDPANVEKLERVRYGISFAIRLKGALDQAGLRGNPTLQLVNRSDDPNRRR
jgi:hypothetical protein